MKKNENGITLVALTITIIVLLILAGISINTGKTSIKKANLEGLKTNMLLIQTKAKEYVENANFDLGVDPNSATEEMKSKAKSELEGEDKGTLVTISDSVSDKLKNIGINQSDIEAGNVYKLTTDNLEKMGIKNVDSDDENGWYIIVYNISETTAEIYNTNGFNGKYSLKDIEKLEI